MIDLERFNRWILMKLKTNVYKHDQNIMALTDLKNNVWISRLIEGRLISLVIVN